MSVRNPATGNGDEMGCLLITECLASTCLPLIEQHGLDSSRSISLPHIANGLVRHVEGLSDIAIAPTLIAFEQHPRTSQRSCIGFAASHKHFQMRSFVFAEVDRSRLFHGVAPVFPQLITNIKLD
jgi:hypothetical protein